MKPSPRHRLLGAASVGFLIGLLPELYHPSWKPAVVNGILCSLVLSLGMVAKLAMEARHRRLHCRVVKAPRISHVVPLERDVA